MSKIELIPFDDESINPDGEAMQLSLLTKERATQMKLLGRIVTKDLVDYSGDREHAIKTFKKQAEEHRAQKALHFLIARTVGKKGGHLTIGHAEMRKAPLFERSRFGRYKEMPELGVGISAWTSSRLDDDMRDEIKVYGQLVEHASDEGLAGTKGKHNIYVALPAVHEGATEDAYQELYDCLTQRGMVWSMKAAIDDRKKRDRDDARPVEQVLFVYDRSTVRALGTPS